MDKFDDNAILNMELEARLQQRIRDLIEHDTDLMHSIIMSVMYKLMNDRAFAIALQKTMSNVIIQSNLY